MLGSKNSKINSLVQIINQEISGAIENIDEGNTDDAKAKLEYAKRITGKISNVNSIVEKSMGKELKEFDDHLKKFSAS
ncbi:MAG: hypothetical protein JSV92_03470 [archaeon]|nr:MAG: hypothetical protein JSV92_03470 [archaeon]